MDYAEQEAIKPCDSSQSDKGKFLFVKLSLIETKWLSNLYKNGNPSFAAQHIIELPQNTAPALIPNATYSEIKFLCKLSHD